MASERAWRIALPLGTASAVLICFLPSLSNDWVNWDDEYNLTANLEYRGLGPENLRWMFTTFHAGHYMPLTWLSLGLDYLLWGMDPAGYHLTSVLWHAAAAVAFYFFLTELYRRGGAAEAAVPWGAAAGALFFALHPLRVESVAWATERRDVVSGLFFMLSAWAYLRERRRQSLGFFAASLLGKASGLMLPVVFLVLDAILRSRAPGRTPDRGAFLALVFEKAPFFALAGAAAAVTFAAQKEEAEVLPAAEWTAADVALQPGYRLWFYLSKTAVPTGLSPLYPFRHADASFLWPTLGSLAVVAGLIRIRKRFPEAPAAGVCCIALLLGTPWLIHAGPQIVADRYSYLSCLPWAALAGGAVCRWGRIESLRVGVASAAAAALVTLGSVTWHQTQVWRDSVTLWDRVIERYPDHFLAYYNRGRAWIDRKELPAALADFSRAIELNPAYVPAWINRGVARGAAGDPAGAVMDMTQALELAPGNPDALAFRGLARRDVGDLQGAIADLSEALARAPPAWARRSMIEERLARLRSRPR